MIDAIIPDAHFVAVCRPGEGAATCRFITAGVKGIECAKPFPELVEQIEDPRRRASFTAQGDNCSGPPAFAVGVAP